MRFRSFILFFFILFAHAACRTSNENIDKAVAGIEQMTGNTKPEEYVRIMGEEPQALAIYKSQLSGIDNSAEIFDYDIEYSVAFHSLGGELVKAVFDRSDRVESATIDIQTVYFQNGLPIYAFFDRGDYNFWTEDGSVPATIRQAKIHFADGKAESYAYREVQTTDQLAQADLGKTVFKASEFPEETSKILESIQQDVKWFLENGL